MSSTFIPPNPPCMQDSTRTRFNKMRKYTFKLVGLWEIGRRKARKLLSPRRWYRSLRKGPYLNIPKSSAESIVGVTRSSFSSARSRLYIMNPDLSSESEDEEEEAWLEGSAASPPPPPPLSSNPDQRLPEGMKEPGGHSTRPAVPRNPAPMQQLRPGPANSLKPEDGQKLRRKAASSNLRHSDLQSTHARVQRVPERPSTHSASTLASGSSHTPPRFDPSSFAARVGIRRSTEEVPPPRNLSAEFWDRRAGPRVTSLPLAPLPSSVTGPAPEERQRVSRPRAESQASSSRGPYLPATSTSARRDESSNTSADSLYNETQAQAEWEWEWERVERGAHEVLMSLAVRRL